MGVSGPTESRIAADAAQVSVPVLFVLQWDDTLFPREKGFELFDVLATKDKRLHANPGAHSAVPPDEFLSTIRFLADHLLPALGSSPADGDGHATAGTATGAGERR